MTCYLLGSGRGYGAEPGAEHWEKRQTIAGHLRGLFGVDVVIPDDTVEFASADIIGEIISLAEADGGPPLILISPGAAASFATVVAEAIAATFRIPGLTYLAYPDGESGASIQAAFEGGLGAHAVGYEPSAYQDCKEIRAILERAMTRAGFRRADSR